MVANEILYRSDLSLRAKGLFAYLFSKPNGWDFAGDRIVKETTDGRKAVYSALKELESQGLLKRQRQSDGKMEYSLEYADTQMTAKGKRVDEKPNALLGHVPKRQRAVKGSISKMELLSNKDRESNTDTIHIQTPKENAKKFFENISQTPLPDDSKQFLIALCERTGLPKATVWHEVQAFYLYWTEKTPTGKKQRWELEKAFEVERRLATWFARTQKMAIRQTTARPRGKGMVSTVTS